MDQTEMALRDVRAVLGRRVDAAHYADEVTIITKNGEPRAALVPLTVLRRYNESERFPS